MIFLILNFLRALVVFIKALLNATYEINPIDYSHKTVAHYNTYHTSITEWSILKPLITVLRTWYILPVHYISVQYSHSNSTPYMDTPNCPVMDLFRINSGKLQSLCWINPRICTYICVELLFPAVSGNNSIFCSWQLIDVANYQLPLATNCRKSQSGWECF